MRKIEPVERRARLARRHRLAADQRADNVLEATRSMICLHGTDPVTVYLSAWARVDGMTVPDPRPGFLLPDDLEVTDPVEPWAALLPWLDPTTMGWFERDWYLGPYKARLFDITGNAVTHRVVGRADCRRLAPERHRRGHPANA